MSDYTGSDLLGVADLRKGPLDIPEHMQHAAAKIYAASNADKQMVLNLIEIFMITEDVWRLVTPVIKILFLFDPHPADNQEDNNN